MKSPMASTSSSGASRVLTWVLWVAAAMVTAGLLVVRFRAGVAQQGNDLLVYQAAAEAVLRGEPPWLKDGYVYSPLVAFLFAPIVAAGIPVATGWTATSLLAAVVALVAFMATVWTDLRKPWMRPVVAVVSSVTLLYSWPVTVDLYFGNSDLILLAVLALAGWAESRRRTGLAGAFIGMAGAVKTWPFGSALWLLRRGARQRVRGVAAVIGVGLAWVLISYALWGSAGLTQWVDATLRYSQQDITTFSVWGFPRNVFGNYGDFAAVVESPVLGVASGVVLALGVLVLLVIALRRPGTAAMSLWNVTACVILLLPVSHLVYRILMLPLVWLWVAHVLGRSRRTLGDLLTLGAVLVWWVLVFRTLWMGGPGGGTTSLALYLVMMGATFAVVALSVLRAARLDAGARVPAVA